MSDVTPETWLPVVGFGEGFYEVSDLGRVRSLHHGRQRILRPGTSGTSRKKGYPMLILYVDGLREKRFVHKLVAEAVHQPPHLDDNVLLLFGIFLRSHQIPSTENMMENAASSTMTRKMPSTTERVVRRPTLAALRSTWKPS